MDGPVVDQAAAPAGQTRAESGEQLCCRLLAGPLQRPPGGTGHRWETSRADGIRSIGPGPGRAAAVQSLLSTSRGSARRRRPNFYPLPQRPRTRRLIAGPQTEPHPKQRGSTRAGHSLALAPPCRFRSDLLGGESAPQLIDPALQPRPPPPDRSQASACTTASRRYSSGVFPSVVARLRRPFRTVSVTGMLIRYEPSGAETRAVVNSGGSVLLNRSGIGGGSGLPRVGWSRDS